ncbi:MAG: hypothetical protein M3O70_14855 [Actinomycetota bacterium]|nr:hypothetical protein [Actinomycetota bacterium]
MSCQMIGDAVDHLVDRGEDVEARRHVLGAVTRGGRQVADARTVVLSAVCRRAARLHEFRELR